MPRQCDKLKFIAAVWEHFLGPGHMLIWVMCVKKSNWKAYVFWIALADGVGLLSGWLSREGAAAFAAQVRQPPFSPPAVLFPIVWTVLYTLMGFGAARVWLASPGEARSRGLNLFVIQLVVNFFWSLVFFNAGRYGLAFLLVLLLLGLVGAMAVNFYRTDKAAGLAQIPYLLWLTVAACLSFGVWYLNR